jgi:hypothetical protein
LSGIKQLSSSTENLLENGGDDDCCSERANRDDDSSNELVNSDEDSSNGRDEDSSNERDDDSSNERDDDSSNERDDDSSNEHSGCDLSFEEGPFRIRPFASAGLRTGVGELASRSGGMDGDRCQRETSDVSEGAYFVEPASHFSLESRPVDERGERTDESPYRAGDSAMAALLARSRGAAFTGVTHVANQTNTRSGANADDAAAVDVWVDTESDDDKRPATPPRLREDVAALVSLVSSATRRKGYESPLPSSIWQTFAELKPKKTVKRTKPRKLRRFFDRSTPTRDDPSDEAPSPDHTTLLIDSDGGGVFSI